MHIAYQIPSIADFPNGFPEYWLESMFNRSISDEYTINSLVSTYVRLVDSALSEYRLGDVQLRDFWDTHTSIKLSAMHKSISHYETCITNMHRAIRCFTRLRKNGNTPT